MDENMNNPQPMHNESKTGIGVVLALFLGIIGLIIGICIYPEGTVARKTFIKGWAWTFGVTAVVAVVIVLIVYFGVLGAAMNSMY